MAEIISFQDERTKRGLTDDQEGSDKPAEGDIRQRWLMNMDLWTASVGEFAASCNSFDNTDGLSVGARHRMWADALDRISWHLRAKAHTEEPDNKGRLVATIHIFESASIRFHTMEEMFLDLEQKLWLEACLSVAMGFIRSPEFPGEKL